MCYAVKFIRNYNIGKKSPEAYKIIFFCSYSFFFKKVLKERFDSSEKKEEFLKLKRIRNVLVNGF